MEAEMAYTLADFQMTATPLTRAVIQTWRESSMIMDMLSYKTDNQLAQEGIRFNSLPTVPWRKIGAAFSDVKVTSDPWRERLHFLGAKIDVPKEYVEAKSLVDIRAQQTDAIMRGSAFAFNEAFFINPGTPSGDEDAIVGLWYRINNDLASAQRFDAALDISPDTAVTSWQHKLFDKVDDLLDRVDGEANQKVLFMGRTTYFRFVSALRSANQLFTEDWAGKKLVTYGTGGAKVVQAGYKVDQTTQILGDAETANTALTGGAKSSIYCVRFGEPYLAGWTMKAPAADDVGLLEDRINYRTVVDGSIGLYAVSPRYAALAYGFESA
jgi:hypothetical protein